jgi:hypothetical protein
MECSDPFEDCEAAGGLPRLDPSAPPACESFENAYARCTCENYVEDYVSPLEACGEVCGLPDQCFVELGLGFEPGAECVQSCEAQVSVVGVDCLTAISDTVSCLGSCDFNALTEQQILDCQDEAQAIQSACE